MNYDDMEKISQVNFVAPYFLISCVVDNMKKNNFGRIINIGSISGVMGEAYASLYSATKSGLIGGTKALALELAEFGITINTINPGWVDTELGNASISDSEFSKEEILDTIPQKRFVSPSEIAGMCQYLISDNAKGVTGQSINLCAGLSVGY
jgi:NAD(P)-dependent dehydrogenase (short-subunit alcohol dehydrogenase family)